MYSTQKATEQVIVNSKKEKEFVKQSDGIPYIHYDHKKDNAVEEDKYIPIPDSRNLVIRSSRFEPRERVNVRFNILEVDNKSEELNRTLMQLDQLGGAFNESGIGMVPYLALLSPALSMVGALGGRALESYARPDKVLGCDVDLKIAKRNSDYLREARPNAFLRYGYYIFLAEPVCCKLYLATNTLKNMRLMVKRVQKPRAKKDKKTGDEVPEYVPLKHCDYIVIRVTQPESDAIGKKRSIRLEDVKRLQGVLNSASSTDPADLKRSVVSIMKEAGMETGEVLQEIHGQKAHRVSKSESR